MQYGICRKAIVLAAGVGSRLDPLTKQVCKPMVTLANRPVMEYIVNLLKRHGINDIACNLHYLPDFVPNYFGDGTNFGVQMNYVTESILTGDAGGVRACKQFLNDTAPFLVIMGDLVTDIDLSYVINQHVEKGALATIALKEVSDVERFGIAVTDEDGFIQQFQEKPSKEEALSSLASTGIYVLSPEIFNHFPSIGEVGFGKQVFPQLIQKGLPVLGVQVFGYWSDVGTIEQYRQSSFDALEGLIDLELQGEKNRLGWIGEGTYVGSCYSDGVALIGANSYIDDDVRMSGRVIIGDNCIIERGCRLDDCIIWSGTIVSAGCSVYQSVVGNGCRLAPHTSLSGQAAIEPRNQFDAEGMQAMIASLQIREKNLLWEEFASRMNDSEEALGW